MAYRRVCLAVAIVLCTMNWHQPAQAAAGDEFFEKSVRPLLVEHCYACHSEQAEKVKGNLKLDSRPAMQAGGKSGQPLVVPGNPQASLLIQAVSYADSHLKMPPDKKLSDEQIATLTKWVEQGASDPRAGNAAPATTPKAEPSVATPSDWWSFQPPRAVPPPDVQQRDWPRGAIDQFILAKLEARHLSPAKPADKRTLLRRATYDLTGLPPTRAELDAFLADNSPDAFARVVDRLLASPHYGERWGRHWLDLVRYTDSLDSRGSGSEGDISEAYRYRDWVVNALNRDLPYDQFVRQQIAGDLLPTEDGRYNRDGVIATGVYAIGEWGTGDADKEKMLTDIIDDQIDVTGRAFLGLTLACARCHDHKFDPISTRDYYGLAGIFFSSHILPNPGVKTNGSPVLRIPLQSPAEKDMRKAEQARSTQAQAELDALLDAQYTSLGRQVLANADQYLLAAHDAARPGGPTPEGIAAERHLNAHALSRWIAYANGGPLKLLNRPVADVRGINGLHGWTPSNADNPSVLAYPGAEPTKFLTITVPPHSVLLHPSPSAGVGVAWKSPVRGQVKISAKVTDSDGVCGNGVTWELALRQGSTRRTLAKGEIPNGGSADVQPSDDAVTQVADGAYVQLEIGPKGDYSCDSTAVELVIAETVGEQRHWRLTGDVAVPPAPATVNPHPDALGHAAVWHFYDLAGAPDQAILADGSALARWLKISADANAPREQLEQAARALRDALTADAPAPADQPLAQLLTAPRGSFWNDARGDDRNLPPEAVRQTLALRTELSTLASRLAQPIPIAHGFQDGGTPQTPYEGFHDARVHIRGRYDRLGDIAPRAFPAVLAGGQPLKINQGSGRRELADWVASPANPLTARVMVNRIWQHHMGEGLVRTPNNFGKLGTPPTHPELLDYLALRFIEGGWSIKSMHRAIMLSATYQQSSSADPATLEADPDNLLWGRANRQRLDAEGLRDSLLAATGELDLAMGGRATNDLNMLRRTLYLMTIRSDRSTYRTLFDAADAGAIVEKRIDSTVAPQALFLMNHPFVLARAKAMASRALQESPADPMQRLDWLYTQLFLRPSTEAERAIANRFLHLATGDGTPDADAWTQLCQVLFCNNEYMFAD